MAVYEYVCENKHNISIQRPMTEPEGNPVCPKCNANLKRIYNTPAIQFKGTGFYSTLRQFTFCCKKYTIILVSYSSRKPPSLSPIIEDWEWQYQGECTKVDPSIFFLEHGERSTTKRKKEQKAISICRRCPVVNKCLEHALKVPEIYGVWGATTEDQRRSMLRIKLH